MPRSAVDCAQHSYIAELEQVARIVSTTRNPNKAMQKTLQLLGKTLGVCGGAVVLNGEAFSRVSSVSWGEYQDQLLQLGRELADGIEAGSGPTARQTLLPGRSRGQAVAGSVLSVPIRGLNQVFGVMVGFDQSHPPDALDEMLSLLHTASIYLGLYLQTIQLQGHLKDIPENRDRVHGVRGIAYDPDHMIGDSEAMQSAMQQLQQAARSRSTVLLRGESGTGKELGARALHKLSDRSEQAFIKLNCAALPESLLESELFGHERGAFTGAVQMRRGRFEMADQGTLFLDEIGDISFPMQVKLLRVLQERTFERVGGSLPIEVDVRIITATNVDLEASVRSGGFREDLYYRLHVVPIIMPSLRERQGDIPQLFGYFLKRFNAENNKNLKISSAAMDLIVSYDWPGNVRELENCVERMVVMARRDIIAPEDVPVRVNLNLNPTRSMLPASPSLPPSSASTVSLLGAVADIEQQRLLEALQRSGGVQTRAASILGITPRQLGYRLKKYRIDPKHMH